MLYFRETIRKQGKVIADTGEDSTNNIAQAIQKLNTRFNSMNLSKTPSSNK